ncbi:MAG: BatD family protein [Flavobacteriaceae bacterium]
MDRVLRILVLIFGATWAVAQTQVSLSADTLNVKLAEQINVQISVTTDKNPQIQFPPLQTFMPFEVIDTTAVDTLVSNKIQTFTKTYAVIHFDTGQVTLPAQKVVVDGNLFTTDSLQIRVNDVAVDTLQQPLFPIKTILPMAKNTTGWWKPYAYAFLICLLLALAYFLISKTQQRIRKSRQKLPPFERAIQALQALENKQLDKQEEYKSYYSDMTDIVRNYLEDEAHIDALESTSDELLAKLELLRDTGNLDLTSETIDHLKEVLRTADLVKFARAMPEERLARVDRTKIEAVVKETQAALPEPTEEERLKNEAYARMRRKQQQRKRLQIAGLSVLGALVVAATVMIINYGAVQAKDRVFGHPTLVWLEQDWITSSYGISEMQLETPDVLGRKALPNRLHQQFVLGSLDEAFLIVLYMEHTKSKEEQTIDLQQKVDKVIEYFDSMGATNIFQKQNDYTTTSGIEGIVASGSFDWTKENGKSQRKTYEVYHFTENKGFQQLQLVYDRDDRYAKELIERILGSVQFKTETP